MLVIIGESGTVKYMFVHKQMHPFNIDIQALPFRVTNTVLLESPTIFPQITLLTANSHDLLVVIGIIEQSTEVKLVVL